MAAGNKTKPTRARVSDYIASRANEQQRSDSRALMKMFTAVTGKRARMWGPSMVGYGSIRYSYESGRSGEMPLAGFAIRGRDLVVYLAPDAPGQKALRAKLGKHSMGKSCLYFRQLADVDTKVLRKLVTDSIADVKRRYGKPD